MSYEVPLNILRELLDFPAQLLLMTLAENSLSLLVCRTDILRGVELTHSHKSYTLWQVVKHFV